VKYARVTAKNAETILYDYDSDRNIIL